MTMDGCEKNPYSSLLGCYLRMDFCDTKAKCEAQGKLFGGRRFDCTGSEKEVIHTMERKYGKQIFAIVKGKREVSVQLLPAPGLL